jgi:hypothetical protein
MRYNWLPWKYILRRVAKSGGFVDPVALLAQFNKFAQPSEVAAPAELLRAGIVFHARGLINARTIQGNLDWVWPFWVRRQFDPLDKAFVPRSFALTQVNLTNRNWTAVGLPDHAVYPIIDPRGLVTPCFDGWSLDAWIVTEAGEALLPPVSRASPRQIQLMDDGGLAVETVFTHRRMHLRSVVDVVPAGGTPVCRIRYTASAAPAGIFIVALRPFNPEGVSFVYRVVLDPDRSQWTVNEAGSVVFDPPVDRHVVSEYRQGDVYTGLRRRKEKMHQSCDIGMASAAAIYRLRADEKLRVSLEVALDRDLKASAGPERRTTTSWSEALRGTTRLHIPDHRMKAIYQAAARTLVLLSPLDIYPGPFYYKRFWFRDAVFILHGLLRIGLHQRAERAIDHFLTRQTRAGYFESQKGEWDSNGQVLWVFHLFSQMTGRGIPTSWREAADSAARWILRKRLPANRREIQAGLLPAGFSAEHLGNNDFYYWDDFWGIAGLKAAAALCESDGDGRLGELFATGAEHFALCVERSLLRSRHLRGGTPAIPASPYRRMDAGAVGSIIAGYPLALWPPREPRLLNTLDFLLGECFIDHAFFQDMIHSGFNIYLTLHCAQCLLRAGDARYMPLVEKVADLATSTGHWPEAVHPQTLGGCMGDGQHAWAAAEWIVMIHNMFAAEEGDALILLRGVPRKWLQSSAPLRIGPIHTRFGPLEIAVEFTANTVEVIWTARWHVPPAAISIRLPGTSPVECADPGARSACISLSRHRRGG